jgi:hypothetical protein
MVVLLKFLPPFFCKLPSLCERIEKMPIDVSACISISIACIAQATTGRHAPVAYCTCAHATHVIEMQPTVGVGGGGACYSKTIICLHSIRSIKLSSTFFKNILKDPLRSSFILRGRLRQ